MKTNLPIEYTDQFIEAVLPAVGTSENNISGKEAIELIENAVGNGIEAYIPNKPVKYFATVRVEIIAENDAEASDGINNALEGLIEIGLINDWKFISGPTKD